MAENSTTTDERKQQLSRDAEALGYVVMPSADYDAWCARLEQTQAARDVLAERCRQVDVEGWTPEHDDGHVERELGLAAACYASAVSPTHLDPKWSLPRPVRLWPWDDVWWKPGYYRRNLVKAGALILAEIERLDRLPAQEPQS